MLPSEAVEHLHHLEFLRGRLETWRANGVLPGVVAAHVIAETDVEVAEWQAGLGLRGVPQKSPYRTVRASGAGAANPQPPLATGTNVAYTLPNRGAAAKQPVHASAASAVPSRAGSGDTRLLDPRRVRALHAAAMRPVTPPPPPKPGYPLAGVSWKQVGTYLLSERTLNGLLGLGAFLILAAAFLISTVNPTGLGPLAHLAMMIATTLVFYGSGAVVGPKLKLVRTGAALLAIGAAFIPLDSWTLGQDILHLEPGTTWFAASVLCLPVYLISHLWLRDRSFALLGAVAGGSVVLAAGDQFGVPTAWTVCALAPLALGYMVVAKRIRDEWAALSWALFWTAQVATPLVMATLLAAKILPDSAITSLPSAWRDALLGQRGEALEYAAGTAWWLGTAFYALAARLSGQRIYAAIAAWLLPCALLFTLTKAPWGSAWYGLCLALLAAGYLAYGRFALTIPRQAGGSYRYQDLALEPTFQVAMALTLVAGLWPFVQFESQIATLAALALTYGAAAFLLRQRAWAYVATYLVVLIKIRQVVVPDSYVTAARHLGLDQVTPALGFAVLAAAMLAIAEIAARRTGEHRRPLLDTAIGLGTWRSHFASPLFSAGYLCSVGALGLTFADATPLDRLSVSAIIGLLVVVAIYACSATSRRAGIFLYLAAALFLLPFSAAAMQLARLLGYPLPDYSMARLLALLGVGYLGLGYVLDRVGVHVARPLYLVGYLLGLGTIAASAPDRAAQVEVLGLAILSYAWSAWLIHRDRHPSYQGLVAQLPPGPDRTTGGMLFQYLAIWLAPVWLLLAQSLRHPDPAQAAYGISLALLAPAYVGLGLRFRRFRTEYRLPWFLAGYAMSALGLIVAATDSTLEIVALSVSIVLCAASAVRSRRAEWLWPVVALTPILLYELLFRFGDPDRFFGPALVALALGYDCLGLRLHHGTVRGTGRPLHGRLAPFSVPFLVAGQAACALGMLLVLGPIEPRLVLLAYALGALHYTASARVSRRVIFYWPLALCLAVVYIAILGMIGVDFQHLGLDLLPGIAAYLLGVELLRSRQVPEAIVAAMQIEGMVRLGMPIAARAVNRRSIRRAFTGWSLPFSLLGHLGALVAFAAEAVEHDLGEMSITFWALAAIYGACTALARIPRWLYPTIGAALAAYSAILALLMPGLGETGGWLALAVPVWALAALAHFVARSRPQADGPAASVTPWDVAWARPLLFWSVLTMATATLASVGRTIDTYSIYTAVAYFPLLALCAILWRNRICVWASLLFAGILCQEALILTGVQTAQQPLYWAGAALLGGCIGVALQSVRLAAGRMWAQPLSLAAAGTSLLALASAAANLVEGHQALQSLAITLAVCSITAILEGTVGHQRPMQIAGVLLLAGAYVCEMLSLNVAQPQAFALPAGVALGTLAFLQWRQGGANGIRTLLEVAALALILGTTLLQAVGVLAADGNHYAYDALLLLEGTAVFFLGAALHWKKTFFSAGAAVVTSMLILLADPLRGLSVVYIALLIGCAMIALVVFLEQRRQQIPLWIDDVRVRLETWS